MWPHCVYRWESWFEQKWIYKTCGCFQTCRLVLEKKILTRSLKSVNLFLITFNFSLMKKDLAHCFHKRKFLFLKDALCQIHWIWPGGFGKEVQNVECLQTDAGKKELTYTYRYSNILWLWFCLHSTYLTFQFLLYCITVYMHMYIACCKS